MIEKNFTLQSGTKPSFIGTLTQARNIAHDGYSVDIGPATDAPSNQNKFKKASNSNQSRQAYEKVPSSIQIQLQLSSTQDAISSSWQLCIRR